MYEYNIGAKVKELRRAKKLTLQAVANETGFSTSLISQIENNNVSPPIATLAKIARFFDVKIGHFFDESEQECPYEILRDNERTSVPKVVSVDGISHGYFHEPLSVCKQNKKMDPFLVKLNEEVATTGTCSHSGEEFLFVMKGTAELVLDDQHTALNEGDSVYFDASIRHRLLSSECGEVEVLAVVVHQGESSLNIHKP